MSNYEAAMEIVHELRASLREDDSHLARIADAIERAYPPYGWEYKQVSPDWLEGRDDRDRNWDYVAGPWHEPDEWGNHLWMMIRRPRQAPKSGTYDNVSDEDAANIAHHAMTGE